MASQIMDVVILLIVGAILLPIGLNQWFTANTELWDAQTVLIYTAIPVIGMAAIAVGLFQGFRRFG